MPFARGAPTQQLARGIAGSISTLLYTSDGDASTGATVTVDVTRADGTVLYTAGAATEDSASPGTYAFALTASDLATLDSLTAMWKVGGVTREQTTHDVVGGFYFTPDEARAKHSALSSGAVSTALLKAVREEVEAEFEAICRVAFVPRYRRVALDGSNLRTQLLPDPMVRTIREVTFVYTSTSSYTLSSNELAALTVNIDGILRYRNSQGVVAGIHTAGIFPYGDQNVIVGYEHGYDRPPFDLKAAAMQRLRERVNAPTSGVPDRAVAFQIEGSSIYRLAQPNQYSTGNPEIDAVLERYAWQSDRIGIA